MTYATTTKTFTITEARYVTSKIAADLQVFREHYGHLSPERIQRFAEEAAYLLNGGWLKAVEYGLKINGEGVFTLRYEASNDGTLSSDDRPGKIPANLDMSNAAFYSFLWHSDKFLNLPLAEQDKIKKASPLLRTDAPLPVMAAGGRWEVTKTYSSNGQGVERKTYKKD
jgi:hypothetical protein